MMRVTFALAAIALLVLSVDARSCKNKNTCKNKGQCYETPSKKPGYRCECAAGFTGDRCEYVATPQNWVRSGVCEYLAVETPVLTYGNAQQACKRQGGYLADIHSEEENQLIAALFEKQTVGRWIGLKQKKAGPEFYYEKDNTQHDQINNYSDWFPGQPGASDEQCTLQDTRDGEVGWAVNKCRDEKKYVCKRCDTDVVQTKRRRRRRKNN
eukprot:m.352465 g.352465  ORF g.352465 m.352465 type:complete len:211 (-) comp16527_c0_seq1:377-1009(-)